MLNYVVTVATLVFTTELITAAPTSTSGPTTVPCEKRQNKHSGEGGIINMIRQNAVRLKEVLNRCYGKHSKTSLLEDHTAISTSESISHMLNVEKGQDTLDKVGHEATMFTKFIKIGLSTTGDSELPEMRLLKDAFKDMSVTMDRSGTANYTGGYIHEEHRLLQYMKTRETIWFVRSPFKLFVEATDKEDRQYAFATLSEKCQSNDLTNWFVDTGNEFVNYFANVLLKQAKYDRNSLTLLARAFKSDMCEAKFLLSACNVALNVTNDFQRFKQRQVNEAFKNFATSVITADLQIGKNSSEKSG